MRAVRVVHVVLVAAVVAALIGVAATERGAHERLREVYTPTYRHIPTAPPLRATIATFVHSPFMCPTPRLRI